jgi:hypothetical protein
MNHIERLTRERNEARAQLADVREALIDLESYLLSAKFQGRDADYVHVRTDMLPRLAWARFLALAD